MDSIKLGCEKLYRSQFRLAVASSHFRRDHSMMDTTKFYLI